MAYPEYYKVLQVAVDASMDDIKKSYHRLAKKYHPDVNQGDKKAENKLKSINEAYAVLGNMAKRAEYDYFGKQQQETAKQPSKPQPSSSSEPIHKSKSRTQKNKSAPSLKVWILHYIFLLSILCGYIYAIYNNRDPNRPYDIATALVNTSAKINKFAISTGQKIKKYYEQGSWRIYLWKHIIQTNDIAMATKEIEKMNSCQGLYDDRGYSLLMLVTQPEMAKILLNAGCEVNYMAPDGKTAYALAVESNNVELAKVLRQHGAGPWKTSKQIWKHIIQTNNTALAEEITRNWKGCNIVFADGRSLLMTTTQTDMAQLLIKAGCDVNYTSPNGETAYTTAIKQNNLKMAQILRNSGAQIRWKK